MISPVINWYFKQRSQDLRENLDRANLKQEELFVELIERLSNTRYGEKYQISEKTTYEDFCAKVPVVVYEDLKPWIDRNMAGEQQLLWPSDIVWYAKSSGTTSNVAKFIPMSFESLEYNHYECSRETLTQYCGFFPETEIFKGKGLLIGGSHRVNELNQNAFYGDLSAVLMNHLPAWVNWKSTPDMEIAMMENWEEKLEKMAQSVYQENVTSMSGVPTWTIVLLNRLLEITGKNNILEIWPNLELFLHGGVSFEPYKDQFRSLIPSDKMHYFETYNASEGFFGLQASPNKSDLLLMTHHGIFYEFYPIAKGPEFIIPLSDVVIGVNYAMVITTVGGLWRYIIGDTIIFTDTKPYTFKITGRTKLFINAFGEELVIENAETAIAIASKETGAIVTDYSAGPIYLSDQADAGHEWLIEFSKEPTSLEEFIRVLDSALMAANEDYQAKRQGDIVMKLPKVISVPKNTFHDWLKSKGKLGGQNKVPRLSNDRKVIEEIKASMGLL